MVMSAGLLSLALLASARPPVKLPDEPDQSRWRRRTAKRRLRTENLLRSIEFARSPPQHPTTELLFGKNVPTTLASPPIKWEDINPSYDPIQGGKIRPDTLRGERKRAQVEAFAHVVSSLLSATISKTDGSSNSAAGRRTTIIDAGSGAGNLAIPLIGLISAQHSNVDLLAVDVNDIALQRLADRACKFLPNSILNILCADLAQPDNILSIIPQDNNIIVVSLHACGAASDMAMALAYKRGAPFVVCPCCTAKSLVKRTDAGKKDDTNLMDKVYNLTASFQRSGATEDIEYPRSHWLRDNLLSEQQQQHQDTFEHTSIEAMYTTLAKVADVGLGPQTPTEQREHQRRAKRIVELDRLANAYERYGYDVSLVQIRRHDPHIYGKGDLLLGAKRRSISASVLNNLAII